MTRDRKRKAPSARAVEIKIYWNQELDTVKEIELSKKRPPLFVIGEAFECDYPVSPDLIEGQSAFQLLSTDEKGRALAHFPPYAEVAATLKNGRQALVEADQLHLDGVVKVAIELGAFRFEVGIVDKEPSFVQVVKPEKSWTLFAVGSLAVHAAFVVAVWLVPPDIRDPMSRIDSDNRYATIMFGLETSEQESPPEAASSSSMTSTADQAPHMARSAGILALLSREAGAQASPLGSDPATSLDALPGQSGSAGETGLLGTGRGGGGTGEGTIGLGNLNTIGHGGGGGTGAGYGRGAGKHFGIRGPGGPSPYGFLNDPVKVYQPGFNTEAYDHLEDNPFLQVSSSPLSTFSIDVDTASYSNIRRFVMENTPPPKDAVRIEEIINYFSYEYRPPRNGDPFSVHVETAECPWNQEHRLARIGLRGFDVDADKRPPSNLVFLIDVSGSMQSENKLPLLRRSMKMLVNELGPRDQVAMVVYAGASGLVLDSTSCNRKQTIIDAIERLEAGGSTNGGAGIRLAYEAAKRHFIEGGINRVILATDGDFNVGTTSEGDLTRLIKDKADTGVFLSVLGFGMGNFKDATLETLADKGNGNYAYIDTLNEAKKVLVDEIGSTLQTIAKDVKIQVEFNPEKVGSYRLIGYENRMLKARDFNDDKKDAGEIGAGHTVTALYELTPVRKTIVPDEVDPLKYQLVTITEEAVRSGELFTLKLRYKKPDQNESRLLTFAVEDVPASIDDASEDFKLAASAAGFGMLLRDSPHKGSATFEKILELANQAKGRDRHGYRAEFINLIKRAKRLKEGVRAASRFTEKESSRHSRERGNPSVQKG